MGDRDLWVVEEDDPDILYRDRPYRRLTITRRLPHLQLLEAQGEVGRVADIDRSLHHGSRGASEQRDPSEEVDTYLMHILFFEGSQYPVSGRSSVYAPKYSEPFSFSSSKNPSHLDHLYPSGSETHNLWRISP